MPPVRLRLSAMLFATELLRPVTDRLGLGATVTTMQLERCDGGQLMELEIRVTKIGSKKVPRNAKPLPAIANLEEA